MTLTTICMLVLPSAVATAQNSHVPVSLPTWGVKTNVAGLPMASVNLGVEVRTSSRTSVELWASYNPFEHPWGISGNRKWKHILIQPEFRFWTGETFRGWFVGFHPHWAFYNIGVTRYRFEGWLAGAGMSLGYRHNLSHRWAVEATIGLGYAHADYYKSPCGYCTESLGRETRDFFTPTRFGVSFVWGPDGQRAKTLYVPPPDTP